MNSDMNSTGAASALGQLQHEIEQVVCIKSMRDHGGATIVINFFIPPLSFILQLVAVALGLFMPLIMLLLKTAFLKIRVIIIMIKSNAAT